MIICTERNDTLLIKLLLDSMSVKTESHDLPDGSSVQIPNLDDCLGLYEELGFGVCSEVESDFKQVGE